MSGKPLRPSNSQSWTGQHVCPPDRNTLIMGALLLALVILMTLLLGGIPIRCIG